jgi:FMN-dependent oxidoreductase (nitrilotriacetate monooxygenase family)
VRAPREVVDLMAKRQLHLVAYMMAGPVCSYHAMWRHPDTETGFLDIEWYAKIARALEYGKFDMVFFPDVLTIFDNYASSFEVTVARGGQAALQLDPMLVLATMASCTSRIGLGATMSTTFFAPYQIARSFATLDHLSRGRAAWNVVTSFNHAEAKNFGADKLPPHDVRYDRADEFIEVCLGLWDTWREGALVMDKRSGVFADPAGIRYLDHEGEWLKCRGPLSVPRSPQGRPVIMQAGASSRGKDFAARWGEVIFTIQNTPELMKKYYDDVKARAPRFEREPDDIKILPTIQPILGETESMAREHQAFVNELIDPLVGLGAGEHHASDRLHGHAAGGGGAPLRPERAVTTAGRDGQPGRRPDRGDLQVRCLRRLHHHPRGSARGLRGIRPHGGPGAAAAWHLSLRVRRRHPARPPRAEAPQHQLAAGRRGRALNGHGQAAAGPERAGDNPRGLRRLGGGWWQLCLWLGAAGRP